MNRPFQQGARFQSLVLAGFAATLACSLVHSKPPTLDRSQTLRRLARNAAKSGDPKASRAVALIKPLPLRLLKNPSRRTLFLKAGQSTQSKSFARRKVIYQARQALKAKDPKLIGYLKRRNSYRALLYLATHTRLLEAGAPTLSRPRPSPPARDSASQKIEALAFHALAQAPLELTPSEGSREALLRKRALLDSPEDQYEYGRFLRYEKKPWDRSNYETGTDWLRKAHAQGHSGAAFLLSDTRNPEFYLALKEGALHPSSPSKRVSKDWKKLLEAAALKNHPRAQLVWGLYLTRGNPSGGASSEIPKDWGKGDKAIRNAALQGDLMALQWQKTTPKPREWKDWHERAYPKFRTQRKLPEQP